MRTRRLVVAALALALLAVPREARAWVVVRAAPVVVVRPAPVVVVTPAPVVVVPAPPVQVAPAPDPSLLTTKLPINTTMWALPPGCNAMTVGGQAYYQCGVNWMKQYTSGNGTYYGVVPPP